MTRSAWIAAVLVTCGCQAPSLQQGLAKKPPREDVFEVTHSEPRSTQPPAPLASPPPAPARESTVANLLQYATDRDNAHRRNPADREALRQARQAYEKVLQSSPSHPYVLHRLGTISDREGRFSEAERYYREALRLDPDNIDLVSDLGYSYLLQDRLVESEQMLQQVINMNPRQPRVRTNLGLVYARMGRTDEAFNLIRSERGEAEARELIAQATRKPPAQPQPPAHAGSASDNSLAQASTEMPAPPGEMNDATRQLYEALARQRTLRNQQQLQNADQTQVLSAPSPWNGREAAPPQIQPAQPVVPLQSQGVPPSQWNQVFSSIDESSGRVRPASATELTGTTSPGALQPRWPGEVQSQQPLGFNAQQHIATRQPGIAQPAPGHPAGAIPLDARMQAARIGLQAGGGTLFVAPPPAERAVIPAGMQQPADTANPIHYDPATRVTASPAGVPSATLPPDQAAELQFLSEQVRQLQQQIAQKRAELEQPRQPPPPQW